MVVIRMYKAKEHMDGYIERYAQIHTLKDRARSAETFMKLIDVSQELRLCLEDVERRLLSAASKSQTKHNQKYKWRNKHGTKQPTTNRVD